MLDSSSRAPGTVVFKNGKKYVIGNSGRRRRCRPDKEEKVILIGGVAPAVSAATEVPSNTLNGSRVHPSPFLPLNLALRDRLAENYRLKLDESSPITTLSSPITKALPTREESSPCVRLPGKECANTTYAYRPTPLIALSDVYPNQASPVVPDKALVENLAQSVPYESQSPKKLKKAISISDQVEIIDTSTTPMTSPIKMGKWTCSLWNNEIPEASTSDSSILDRDDSSSASSSTSSITVTEKYRWCSFSKNDISSSSSDTVTSSRTDEVAQNITSRRSGCCGITREQSSSRTSSEGDRIENDFVPVIEDHSSCRSSSSTVLRGDEPPELNCKK